MSNVVPVSKIKALRQKTGLNQKDFWGKIGVSQGGGSRYENGRAIPKPVSMLIDLCFGKKPLKDLANLRAVPVAELVEAGK